MSDPTKPAGRRRKPVQERSRHTVDSILEAATRLFDRGTATTNGIAKLAGVSIGYCLWLEKIKRLPALDVG